MSPNALRQLIANGANSAIEFKRDDLRPDQLAREFVAFANFKGGSVLIGVEDDGAVSGVRRDDLETWLMDVVFGRHIHPMIVPFFQVVVGEDGTRVAVVSVSEGTSKPYVVRANDREEAFIRLGSTSRRATREQLARSFESGGMLHAELLPVSGSALEDLDLARLEDYLVRVIGDSATPTAEAEWHSRLLGLGFLTERSDQAPICTIAGLVLFGYRPRLKLRTAGVRWMSFAGTDLSYDAQDDKVIDGPLVGLWKSSHSEPPLDFGLVERTIDRMQPFVRDRSEMLIDGVRRTDQQRYAPGALREAVLNALIHRDWTRAGDVEVVGFSDRLEITSPGALQNSMTIEKMLAGQRTARNPVIMAVMRDYAYVEQRGMGVRRRIVPLTRQWSGRDAVFEATDDYFRVTLPAAAPAPRLGH
jgi:ATP-dependent DNA helicase RecG